METLESLHVLIQRLSHPEKRYISAHLGGKEKGGRDATLFQVLVHQKAYDKARIKQELNKHKSLARFTSAAVVSLRSRILRELRQYREESSLELQMRNMLEEDSILRERLMHRLRTKNLIKLENMARGYEAWSILVQVLERQYAMLLRESSSPEALDEKLNQVEWATNQTRHIWQVKTLYNRMFAYMRLGHRSNSPELGKILDQLDAIGIKAPEQQSSFWAKHMAYNIQYYRYSMEGKHAEAHQCRILQKRLWEAHPKLVEYNSMEYKRVLANYLVACFVQEDFSPFKETLDLLKSMDSKSLDEAGEIFQNVTYLEFVWYMNSDQKDKAVALIPTIEDGLVRFADKIDEARRQALLVNVAILYFSLARYREAVDWCYRVMDHKTQYRPDAKVIAGLLAMVCQYENGNLSLLESLKRSLTRKLRKNEHDYAYHRQLFRLLDKVFHAPNGELKKHRKAMMAFLETTQKENPRDPPLACEELRVWLKSK